MCWYEALKCQETRRQGGDGEGRKEDERAPKPKDAKATCRARATHERRPVGAFRTCRASIESSSRALSFSRSLGRRRHPGCTGDAGGEKAETRPEPPRNRLVRSRRGRARRPLHRAATRTQVRLENPNAQSKNAPLPNENGKRQTSARRSIGSQRTLPLHLRAARRTWAGRATAPRRAHHRRAAVLQPAPSRQIGLARLESRAVSYTHLTLPTIYSV